MATKGGLVICCSTSKVAIDERDLYTDSVLKSIPTFGVGCIYKQDLLCDIHCGDVIVYLVHTTGSALCKPHKVKEYSSYPYTAVSIGALV